MFSPNGNVYVPMRHTALHGITWSDIHPVSEKELAKDPTIEKADYAFSQSGRNPGSRRSS